MSLLQHNPMRKSLRWWYNLLIKRIPALICKPAHFLICGPVVLVLFIFDEPRPCSHRCSFSSRVKRVIQLHVAFQCRCEMNRGGLTHGDDVGAQQGGVAPQKIQLRRQQPFPVHCTETDCETLFLNTDTSLWDFPQSNRQWMNSCINVVPPVEADGSLTPSVAVVVVGGVIVTGTEEHIKSD